MTLKASHCGIDARKALFISRAVSIFYGTEIEILACFGPVGNTDKTWGRLFATFEVVFLSFQGQKKKFIFF